jgi:AraC-like DNA-binding protein
MLTEGHAIDEVTSTLGFCDRNYLSRRFREKFGKTISQYRQELMI